LLASGFALIQFGAFNTTIFPDNNVSTVRSNQTEKSPAIPTLNSFITPPPNYVPQSSKLDGRKKWTGLLE
jgi:hypothetical protein